MPRRFRRHSRTHSPDAPARDSGRPINSPFNLLWIIFGVVVLASVIFYDQRQIAEARQHIDQAHNFQQHGVYSEALKEYQTAYSNKRLGRRQKGEVALAIGDIYYDQFENYDMAHTYFVRAKQDNPKLFQNSAAQERLKSAAQKSAGAGVTKSAVSESEETTSTVIQRVQLLAPPQEDLRGPIVARYKGGEVHAGEFLRYLRGRPEYMDPHFRDDPRKLEDLLKQYVGTLLHYQAGIDAGIQKDPDISSRLYDYQKELIGERYAVLERQKAREISPKQVQEYYDQNRGQYVKPASIELALIKTTTEDAAQQALAQIRKGVPFSDVASSVSVDEKSAKQGGLIGSVSENDKEVPGLGPAGDLIKQLIQLRAGSVSAVTPLSGSFYIFRVLRVTPARNTTLDEARPEIEMKLMGKAVDAASVGLEDGLRTHYDPEVALEGLQKFWQFATVGTSAQAESNTSPTAAVSRPPNTTGSVTARSTKQGQ